MKHEKGHSPRKPLLANVTWTAAFAVVLLVPYLLSYAPVVAYAEKHGSAQPTELFDVTDGMELPIYRPVDLLIDYTPLRRPLVAWVRLWGVDNTFIVGRWFRTGRKWESPNQHKTASIAVESLLSRKQTAYRSIVRFFDS